MRFCRSAASHIRLLAPAGCGKTLSLLYRCLELWRKAKGHRFLIVTFTTAAAIELRRRLAHSPEFDGLQDAVTISTLNAYGYRRLRSNLKHTTLLSKPAQRHFAVWNQLRPTWKNRSHLSDAINRNRNRTRPLMYAIDQLKNLGFDHTTDTNFERFRTKLDALQDQGLSPHISRHLAALTKMSILDPPKNDGDDFRPSRLKEYYDRFFTFWRDSVARMHEETTFTFEDQKYWCWLDLRSPGPDGRTKPPVSGAARYSHVLVDEFQDISPLDVLLVRTIVGRHKATLTIAGDDDQAIFEWRGATPTYILDPEAYFGKKFQTHVLAVNYRSPQNIVEFSQNLIEHNGNREPKRVAAAPGASTARIEVLRSDPIGGRLRLVSDLARDAGGGSVGVIGRVRSQLIPYEVYYASDGGPIRTATDLDVFASGAFDDLMKLLEIWDGGQDRQRPVRATEDALAVCNLIKRFPLRKADQENLRHHLKNGKHTSCAEAIAAVGAYSGAPLSGKTHDQLCEIGTDFIEAGSVSEAIIAVNDQFRGLRFDFEKAEDDIWFTDPPLKQLANMASDENLSAEVLITRLEAAKDRLQHWKGFEDETEVEEEGDDRPLHLMTATRAKGKEFDTVVVLDCIDGLWPHKHAKTAAEREAERRLFYVAFTRARKRLVLLAGEDAPLSPFIAELGLPRTASARK